MMYLSKELGLGLGSKDNSLNIVNLPIVFPSCHKA